MRWVLLFALVLAGAVLFWLGRRSPPSPPSSPPAAPAMAFVGSGACTLCHEKASAAWAKTPHARALGKPDLGAFDGRRFEDARFAATPRADGERGTVLVEPRGGGPPGYHGVTFAVGGARAQMYLFTDALGAWRLLPIAWTVQEKAWRATHAVLLPLTGVPCPGDARDLVFNRDCASCHVTRFDAGFKPRDQGGDSYDSKMAEPGVACEACHGPGALHARAPAKWNGGGAGACLRCHYAHEWRTALPDEPAPFEEAAVSRNFDGDGFFPDGRLSADRHAGTTFVQSKCARGGATCLSCHAVHGEARPSGDAQCAPCHDAARYARREHTFHADVRCVDCHMPRLLPAPLLFLRDHALRSPDPLLTEKLGVPNACNVCHQDRSPAWAREAREKWWGPGDPRLLALAETVAALRQGPAPLERLEEVALDASAPLFFRATALRALPAGSTALRSALGAAEVDLVQVACERLASAPDPLAATALLSLLEHPARTVRLEAAFALARAGWRARISRPALHEDVRAMLGRLEPSVPRLARAGWILGALGAVEEAALLLPPLARRDASEAAPLMQRRGRDLAQMGRHADALLAYDDARRIFGDPLPPLLYVDSADSLMASGDSGAAETTWRHAVERVDRRRVEHAIAHARLMGVEGRGEEGLKLLQPIAEQLAGDPLGGEMLRRVRWSLDALRPK